MGLLQVIRRVPPPTFYDVAIESTSLGQASVGALAGWQDELAFATLRLAYAASGGIVRSDDLDRLLADHGARTFIDLANDDEAVFGFRWDESLWIPMFQFRRGDLSIRAAPRQIRAELGGAFDGWSVSAWFVEPNQWLERRRPIDLLDSDLGAVLHAARADRFVAAG